VELATTCNNNEKRLDAEKNAELSTKWTKTTWKGFGYTIRRGRNTDVKALLLPNDDIFIVYNRQQYIKTFVLSEFSFHAFN